MSDISRSSSPATIEPQCRVFVCGDAQVVDGASLYAPFEFVNDTCGDDDCFDLAWWADEIIEPWSDQESTDMLIKKRQWQAIKEDFGEMIHTIQTLDPPINFYDYQHLRPQSLIEFATRPMGGPPYVFDDEVIAIPIWRANTALFAGIEMLRKRTPGNFIWWCISEIGLQISIVRNYLDILRYMVEDYHRGLHYARAYNPMLGDHDLLTLRTQGRIGQGILQLPLGPHALQAAQNWVRRHGQQALEDRYSGRWDNLIVDTPAPPPVPAPTPEPSNDDEVMGDPNRYGTRMAELNVARRLAVLNGRPLLPYGEVHGIEAVRGNPDDAAATEE